MLTFETSVELIAKSFLSNGLKNKSLAIKYSYSWYFAQTFIVFFFPLSCDQETFWRIPAKISASQLRSAAAALSPSAEERKGDEEQYGSRSLAAESEEEEEVSGEQRAQALRALLLARKKKHHTSEYTGMCGSFMPCTLSQMTAINYSFVTSVSVKLHGAHIKTSYKASLYTLLWVI